MKEKQTDSLEIFKSAPIGQAVLKNAIPAMVAMMMVLIYNLADTFFIGQTKDAFMIAAVSLVTPVFLLFMAVGTVFGIGGTSVISRAMGEGRKEYAKKVCSFCMWSCVIAGIVMVIIIFAFMDSILKMLGASADTMEYARQYLSIVTVAGPFMYLIVRSLAYFCQIRKHFSTAWNFPGFCLLPAFCLVCFMSYQTLCRLWEQRFLRLSSI